MHPMKFQTGQNFLGKPYEPNAIIKNDMEFILMQRKPGGYRKPTNAQREASRINKTNLTVGFNKSGISLGHQPSTIPPHSHWNWPPGWYECFPSQETLFLIHFAAPGRRWWQLFETAATALGWKLIRNIAGWQPHT